MRLALIFNRKYKQLLLVRSLLRICRVTAMKQPMTNPRADQNWNWPEKTWFQERLNAIKVREQELRRKPWVTVRKPAPMIAEPHEKTEPAIIELSPDS
jgi:hypothetical protein